MVSSLYVFVVVVIFNLFCESDYSYFDVIAKIINISLFSGGSHLIIFKDKIKKKKKSLKYFRYLSNQKRLKEAKK